MSGVAPDRGRDGRFSRATSFRLGVTATHARELLLRLTAERYDAHDVGLGDNLTFMADLEADIVECRETVVLLSVLEIAVLRAQFEGPLLG